jgi:DHA2 family methylenomycin A resistance protein-like MFS transporter
MTTGTGEDVSLSETGSSASVRDRSRVRDDRPLVLTTMCAGMFLVLLDVTIVNVALPTIGDRLHADLAGLQWVVAGYAVALAGLLLAGGTIGDVVGHKRVVLAGLGLFGAASLGCGAAPSVEALVAARVLQGAGAAMLLPATLAVIARAYPRRAEQARALGIWAGVSSLALPAGPLLGGLLVGSAGWRAVFLINIPVVALALCATLALVEDTRGDRARHVDVLGTAAGALALAAVVLCAINAGRDGLSSLTVAAGVVAVVSAALFFAVERRSPDPALPPALLRARDFVGANAIAGAMNVVGIGMVFVLTLYLQTVQGRSAMTAGAALVPLFAPLAALSPVTGRLVARLGPRPLMLAGLVVGAAGALTLLGVQPGSGYLDLLPALIGLGVGMGLLTASVVAAAIRAVPADRSGLASGVNNAARQAAGALGIAIFGAVAGRPASHATFVSGLHDLAVASAVLWLLAAVATVLTIPAHADSS